MAEAFSRSVLKVVISQICQTIGWHAIQTTPLEIMIDILHRYISEVGKLTHLYSEQFGHTKPNLDDVGLAFRDMGINLTDLEEYIRNVDSVPCIYEIPKYPITRDSHLNFLKPGSREVVTRPVHVHEHLPPMHPEMEEEEYGNKQQPLSVDTASTSGATSPQASPKNNVFKRPGDPISVESPAVKRARLMLEEEGRPLREISSVMMTTSGFLSPAREGKLPESRTPLQPSDSRSNSPQPTSYPMVPPEVKGDKKSKKLPFKKTVEGITKIGDKENKKKDNKGKDTVKVDKPITPPDESKVKKLVSMKELSKLKALKSGALKIMAHASTTAGPSTSSKTPKISLPKLAAGKAPFVGTSKAGKMPGQPKAPKVDKSYPLPNPPLPQLEKNKDVSIVEGKLSSEPDKQKLNIFKKISKVKEDKAEKMERQEHFDPPSRDSRESSPGLVIDESEVNSRQREVRMAQIDDCIESVIQRSMEIAEEEGRHQKERKSPLVQVCEASSSKVDETINDVVSGHASGPGSDHDVYMFDDDFSPPGTPSTPRTPELPTTSKKGQDQKEKKRKREKSRAKKEGKGKSPKGSISPKKVKMEVVEPDTPERPKTPEGPEVREKPLHAPVFPFFPHFPPAPGLIPPPIGHPLFPGFPLISGKNLPHPAMPNLPMPPPLFMQPRPEELSEPKEKPVVGKPPLLVAFPGPPILPKPEKPEKPQPSTPIVEKKSGEKKVKEHKKKEKDKTKKKKDKKEKAKAKEKAEKKKLKIEKKDKEKGKEKKEKKEKKKEKAAAALAAADSTTPSVSIVSSTTSATSIPPPPTPSVATTSGALTASRAPTPPTVIKMNLHKEKETPTTSEGRPEVVPKITFRLGPPSPRPPTPDASGHKTKIVIKPIVKNQHDERNEAAAAAAAAATEAAKREPSPELARISALITRPPKQKATSKTTQPKADNVPESSTSPTISVPPSTTAPSPVQTTGSSPVLGKKQKSVSKSAQKIKGKELAKKMGVPSDPDAAKEPVPFYYDDKGNEIWICPECGGQDDGTPMIGCDDCDAWYHWVCVGIQVPPDENEDWYCRVCIMKKQESIIDKKKKSRKKKVQT